MGGRRAAGGGRHRSGGRKVRNVCGSLLPIQRFGGVASLAAGGADSMHLPSIGQYSLHGKTINIQTRLNRVFLSVSHF